MEKAGYSKKFFEARREEITIHKAAKQAFDELGLKKIPRVKELNKEYYNLMSEKKTSENYETKSSIADCLEELEPFIEEILPQEEELNFYEIDCMDKSISDLFKDEQLKIAI